MCRRRSRAPRRGSRPRCSARGGTSAAKRPRSTFVVASTRPLTAIASSLPPGSVVTVPATQSGSSGASGSTSSNWPGSSSSTRPSPGCDRSHAAADQLRPRAHREHVVAGGLEQRALVAPPLLPLAQDRPERGRRPALPAVGDVDLVVRVRVALAHRHAVDRLAQPQAELARDRRQHVDRPHRGVLDAALALARQLDEQRHVGDVVDVGGRRPPPPVAGLEAHAVVGQDHHRARGRRDRSSRSRRAGRRAAGRRTRSGAGGAGSAWSASHCGPTHVPSTTPGIATPVS